MFTGGGPVSCVASLLKKVKVQREVVFRAVNGWRDGGFEEVEELTGVNVDECMGVDGKDTINRLKDRGITNDTAWVNGRPCGNGVEEVWETVLEEVEEIRRLVGERRITDAKPKSVYAMLTKGGVLGRVPQGANVYSDEVKIEGDVVEGAGEGWTVTARANGEEEKNTVYFHGVKYEFEEAVTERDLANVVKMRKGVVDFWRGREVSVLVYFFKMI